jgi:hypothetical protein
LRCGFSAGLTAGWGHQGLCWQALAAAQIIRAANIKAD